VWLDDAVRVGEPSEPFLFNGFERRAVHLAHDNAQPIEFTLQVDAKGDGEWTELRRVDVPASGYRWIDARGGRALRPCTSRRSAHRAASWKKRATTRSTGI